MTLLISKWIYEVYLSLCMEGNLLNNPAQKSLKASKY